MTVAYLPRYSTSAVLAPAPALSLLLPSEHSCTSSITSSEFLTSFRLSRGMGSPSHVRTTFSVSNSSSRIIWAIGLKIGRFLPTLGPFSLQYTWMRTDRAPQRSWLHHIGKAGKDCPSTMWNRLKILQGSWGLCTATPSQGDGTLLTSEVQPA